MMVAYIDAHKDEFGVEPICETLQFAPSTYYAATQRARSARALRDAVLMPLLLALWVTSFRVYGPTSCGRLHSVPATTSAGTSSPV